MPGYRREKIASLIRVIVGEAIIHKLHDPRVSPFTSVTRVEVARDLSVAKIGISVAGEKSDERRTMAAIHHATGHPQRMVAEALNTRVCPKLRFAIDDSVDRLVKIGLAAVVVGAALLLLSVLVARLRAGKSDRYKDVEI